MYDMYEIKSDWRVMKYVLDWEVVKHVGKSNIYKGS